MFTARYAPSPYTKQARLVFKGLKTLQFITLGVSVKGRNLPKIKRLETYVVTPIFLNLACMAVYHNA